MLTEAQIRATTPKDKPYKVYDTRGLYLRVEPNGGRLWRFKYRFNGKEKLLSFGAYPYVSLKRARDRREEARRLLEDGKDPSAQRSEQKMGQGMTFELVAKEWLELQRHRFAAATFVKAEWTFNDLINPYIGSRPDQRDHCAGVAVRLSSTRRTRATRNRTPRQAALRPGVPVRDCHRTRRA